MWMTSRRREERNTASSVLRQYAALQQSAQRETARLFRLHAAQLSCRKGCSLCCDDISVLPIERYALARWLRSNRHYLNPSLSPPREGANRCPFLHRRDESCCIYPVRPLICRFHGLPIRYPVEEYDVTGEVMLGVPREWTFSWCELNFPDIDSRQAQSVFSSDAYIDMEGWNAALKRLNSTFLAGKEGKVYRDRMWQPLSTLLR